MIANTRAKPMRVRLCRLSPAGHLPVHVGWATVTATPTIMRSGRHITVRRLFTFRSDEARKPATHDPTEIVHDRKGGRHKYEAEKGRGEQPADQCNRHRGAKCTTVADSQCRRSHACGHRCRGHEHG